MNSTVIEKIIEEKVGRRVEVGEKIMLPLDLVVMRDFGGPNVIKKYVEKFGDEKPLHPERVAFTFDLHLPARQIKEAENQKACREFAKKYGIRVFDVNNGIGQHTLLENGMIKPGSVVIGTDSHMNLLGAANSFSTGVGTTDIVAGMRFGRTWFKVPETIKINVEGELSKGVYAKDVILSIIREMGSDGASYKAVEFYGDIVEKMNLAARITMASMVTEMDGKISFFPMNEMAVEELRNHIEFDKVYNADENAEYSDEYTFETPSSPQIACPHSPDNVKSIEEVEGIEIDQAFIGSCTNGRLEDLREAAKILKGNRVREGFRLIITPATINVARAAEERGYIKTFLEAGAIVTNPSCALCTIGHPGVLATGDATLSTSNRNFPGKIGKGSIYLCSPAVAAYSAIKGRIADPREVL